MATITLKEASCVHSNLQVARYVQVEIALVTAFPYLHNVKSPLLKKLGGGVLKWELQKLI